MYWVRVRFATAKEGSLHFSQPHLAAVFPSLPSQHYADNIGSAPFVSPSPKNTANYVLYRDRLEIQYRATMDSPNLQDGSDEAPEMADEDLVEWKDNGLMLELAPVKLEKIYEYEPGGHHPVHLGDVLGDAYRVIHKLGHGGFATVWLARDLSAKDTTKYVALKIIKADSSGDDCPEFTHGPSCRRNRRRRRP